MKQSTITKQKISDHLSLKIGFAKSITERIVSELFNEIIEILKAGGEVQLPNFGTFSIHSKKARPGVNMNTKERVIIAPRDVVRFVPSRNLKVWVNNAK